MISLNLSPEQFQKLIYLAAAGEFALTGHLVGGNKDLRSVLNLLMKKAYEEGLSDKVDRFGEDYELKQGDMDEIADQIGEFCDTNFWDKLAELLAGRDISQKYSEAQWEAMDRYQRFETLELQIIHYEQEFEEHGLERLEIKK